ncbi:GNAT family N-acetyltransferase [Bacillus alkalicellulosilyticus]|uniref:GNAT family N-acetyltransferase n=1 Tax=Alkalihalobacterium alkalicellulosilyticum TaxID=1912214 RepID=UPI000997A1DA|nr:GNAT family N-acetyltransferase [Bacillus alkalicellulosilyticus]
MSGSLKAISKENVEECSVLYRKVFNSDPWNDGWLLDDVKERLSDIISNPHYWGVGLYSDGGRLVGFLVGYSEKWLQERHFHVIELCVDLDFQNKGIGTRLITALENYCNEVGINNIYLVTAKGGQAEHFYNKNDFITNSQLIMMSKALD